MSGSSDGVSGSSDGESAPRGDERAPRGVDTTRTAETGRAVSPAAWGVDDLTVSFGARVALDGVSLDVRPGSVTVVVGGDGAGKTTLLRAMAGAARPRSGRVRRPDRREIGYISGSSGLYGDLTVDENVAFVGAAYGLSAAARDRRATDLLRRTGVEGVGGRLAGRLSGGMRQKLAFALAMLHEPRLLVLDEPTTGVDPVSRSEVWRLIAQAAADGAAVLVATTYIDEAERAAHVLVLDEGRAVAAGPPETVAAALPRPDVTGASREPGDAEAATPVRGAAPLAETRAVTRRFGPFVAADTVDMVVRPGEIVGLLGANGAGKTTVIRMLLGLLRPDAGQALLFGAPPTRESRRRIGYVPQGLGLWDDMSAAENLAFAASAFGSPLPTLDADLEAARDTLVAELPLGLKRRLAFAAALAHEPDLLVLDEPTSGVDPQARARLWNTVHAAAAGGAGVLVTTHYLEETSQCDRLVIMAGGRVAAAGREAAIVGDRTAVEVGLEPADDTALAQGTDPAAFVRDATAAGPAPGWAAAFGALTDAGLPVALHGRTLRVAGGDEPRVRAALDARGLRAGLRVVPATLEETFVELALAGEVPTESHPPTGAHATTGAGPASGAADA